jgi:predicted RNase H-like nuclease (RuvC/YqgF family)
MSIVIGKETIVKDKDLIWWLDRITELEKQNKKLNEYNRRLKQANEDLRKQNRYWNKIVDIIPQDEKSVAEETIQDLQERIRFLEQCLDNKEKVNKSLREENKRLSDFLECEA